MDAGLRQMTAHPLLTTDPTGIGWTRLSGRTHQDRFPRLNACPIHCQITWIFHYEYCITIERTLELVPAAIRGMLISGGVSTKSLE
jgi:hypothetical protein